MELKRRITELEQEILNLKAKFADEMEQISEKMAQARNEFELQIDRLKKEQTNVISQLKEEHSQKEKASKAAHDNEIAMLRASLG